ncbi:hypothetical protein BDZ45DRAFT_740652 [Acephala macrosclerotiorum]|nr:hypothetical protein BDZ45DRAFT_740652 [Acephala macrosclerotiorum]
MKEEEKYIQDLERTTNDASGQRKPLKLDTRHRVLADPRSLIDVGTESRVEFNGHPPIIGATCNGREGRTSCEMASQILADNNQAAFEQLEFPESLGLKTWGEHYSRILLFHWPVLDLYTQAPHRESSNIPGQGIATNLDSASSQKAPHQPTSSILSPPLLRHHSTIFICRDLVAPEKNVNVIYEAIGDYRTVVDAIGDV